MKKQASSISSSAASASSSTSGSTVAGVEEASAAQRAAPHFGGSAMETSQVGTVVTARGAEKRGADAGVVDHEHPRDGGGESVVVERRGDFAAVCRWTIAQFSKVKNRSLWSRYFEVGGYDCRLLVYPRGDNQALPGYLSVYLQVTDPRSASSSKWDCFASYRLSVVNQRDATKSIQRDSWHRFSVKKKSHGWCDFTPASVVLDPKSGFMVNESVLITTEILILSESVTFSREPELATEVLSGKFTWKVHNLSLFKEMIKTQKIMSPVFPAGECNLRLSVYQSSVNGADYLSMCLESKDTDKATSASTSAPQERSCWCLFRMSVLNLKPGSSHIHRDSYGRFAGDNKSGDNTSLGWNDFMKMADFVAPDAGYMVDDSATFTASFHVIKETGSFARTVVGGRPGGSGSRKNDGFHGKFTWKIDNFTKLKELLKKRKVTGLCIKSRRFQVGNRDCRLIVYPRGQSQPPQHLSMFLEVTDSRGNGNTEWSCFVSHRLSVVNRTEERCVSKESQNRYCKAAKDWGWREFITLTNLFDQDSGFLVQDTVTFAAEVLILKETSTMEELCPSPSARNDAPTKQTLPAQGIFTWKVENFLAFKEIMETRKIFSRFFQAGGCELRIGVYESFDTLCIYLESDQSAGSDPDRNFWVRYRMGVHNHKHPDRTAWKESSICTKTWNNSVLQFMKVSEMVEPDAGFLSRDTIVFVCEILDCCPWFEFSDLEVLVSDEEEDLSTELLGSDDSYSQEDEDVFRSLLSRAGFDVYGDSPQLLLDPSQLQVNLREKLLMDSSAVTAFVSGLRVYLEDPIKMKRLLLPTKVSSSVSSPGKQTPGGKTEATSPSLMNLFMGVKVLQEEIVDLLLDIMAGCVQPPQEVATMNGSVKMENGHVYSVVDSSDVKPEVKPEFAQRLDDGADELPAVQSSDSLKTRPVPIPVHPDPSSNHHTNELKWPEQAEELLGLIINSLKSFDAGSSPEPRKRTQQSAQRMGLVLEKCPKHLQAELVPLVPKLVDPAEHSTVATALLNWLETADKDLRLWVLHSLTHLHIGSETWEQALHHCLVMLEDCEDDDSSLAGSISCIFKAASESRQSSHGAKAVRGKLKRLGSAAPPAVLDVVKSSVRSCPGAAEALLEDIDTDVGGSVDFPVQNSRVIDVEILVELLSVPSLRPAAQGVFERSVARRAFGEEELAAVLERRRSQAVVEAKSSNSPSAKSVEENDFKAVLGLVEVLSRSKNLRVKEFVSALYTIMFKLYGEGGYRERMLRGLVERATSSNSSPQESQLGLDVLTVVVKEDARPVLAMMKDVADVAQAGRAALWQQLQSSKEELAKARSEKQSEISKLTREKTSLAQRLSEAEALQARLKVESRAEHDRLVKEKRDITEQLRAGEKQLEWARSEREEEVAKAAAEKKSLQDKLRESDSQLSQLKARKREEAKSLQKNAKERNAVAERLKSSEALCRKLEEDLKRVSSESASWEQKCKSLDEERRKMEMTIQDRVRDQLRRNAQLEEALANARNNAASKEQEYETKVAQLSSSLKEEMSKHALLYGLGLEKLLPAEIDTLAKFHQDGVRMTVEEKLRREREHQQRQFQQHHHLQQHHQQQHHLQHQAQHHHPHLHQPQFSSGFVSSAPVHPTGKNGTWYSRAGS